MEFFNDSKDTIQIGQATYSQNVTKTGKTKNNKKPKSKDLINEFYEN